MRILFPNIVLILMLAGPWSGGVKAQEQIEKEVFRQLISIPSLPVEDQGSTGTCWSFSSTSFLESEMQKMGLNPIDLSDIYFVRSTYVDKAEKYLRYHGKSNFSEGSLGHDVFMMLNKYGAVPESVYSGLVKDKIRHNHSLMLKDMRSFLDERIRKGAASAGWQVDFNHILDRHLGPVPMEFTFDGEMHTPRSFAKKYIPFSPDDFVSITSFEHHPYWHSFILEIPDNYAHASYLNVPLETLVQVTDHVLSQGHSIVWDCDVSDKGFRRSEGVAICPENDTVPINYDMQSTDRQLAFDRYDLTDDHLMHIVGTASDQANRTFYHVKNSWGKQFGHDGFLYASLPYFLKSTISITVNVSTLPEDLMQKIAEVR